MSRARKTIATISNRKLSLGIVEHLPPRHSFAIGTDYSGHALCAQSRPLALVTIWRIEEPTIRSMAKFRVGDAVRFIGTETLQTVKQYHKATQEYNVQRGDDGASSQRALGIYLEWASVQAAGVTPPLEGPRGHARRKGDQLPR